MAVGQCLPGCSICPRSVKYALNPVFGTVVSPIAKICGSRSHGIELWALLARVCNYKGRKASTEGDNFTELENKAAI